MLEGVRIAEVRWQSVLARSWQIKLRLIVKLNLAISLVQVQIVPIAVFVVLTGLTRSIAAWSWDILRIVHSDDTLDFLFLNRQFENGHTAVFVIRLHVKSAL